jgi:hypothetical membrane protein
MYILFLLGPALFVTVAFVLSFITPGYSPVHNTISELALGPNHWYQTINFAISGLLLVGLGVLLYRSKSKKVENLGFVSICIAIMGAVLILSSIFRTDPVTSTQLTSTGTIHNFLFLIGMLGMVIAQLVVSVKSLRLAYGVYSLASSLLSLAALAGVIGLHNSQGIPQRVLVLLVMTWITVTALRVRRPVTFNKDIS